MTRRERHIRIIESWGPHSTTYRFHRDETISRRGFAAFTDEAIEEIAARMVSAKRRQDRYNREARARRNLIA